MDQDVSDIIDLYAEQAKRATNSPVFARPEDDGITIVWGDPGDPLNYIWQTKAQVRDIIAKLEELL